MLEVYSRFVGQKLCITLQIIINEIVKILGIGSNVSSSIRVTCQPFFKFFLADSHT